MGTKNKRWWQGVPWGWVLASAYFTALVCVGVSQVVGPETAVTVLRDYQTLVAGLATVAALFIAAQQLKRQADRDAIDARRHYRTELDAMKALDLMATQLARTASQRPDVFDPSLPFDRPRWERFRQQTDWSVASSVSNVIRELENYNRLVKPDDLHPFHIGIDFGRHDYDQHRFERQRVHYASMLLLEAIRERRGVVLREIDETS